MLLSTVVTLLQAALALLITSQTNTSLPPSFTTSAVQVAQEAIGVASQVIAAVTSAQLGQYTTQNTLHASVSPVTTTVVPVATTTTTATSTPAPAPVTCALSASSTQIAFGGATTLSWASKNATGGTITPGIGSVGPNGSSSVSPTQTTSYFGSFSGSTGNAYCALTMVVLGSSTSTSATSTSGTTSNSNTSTTNMCTYNGQQYSQGTSVNYDCGGVGCSNTESPTGWILITCQSGAWVDGKGYSYGTNISSSAQGSNMYCGSSMYWCGTGSSGVCEPKGFLCRPEKF